LDPTAKPKNVGRKIYAWKLFHPTSDDDRLAFDCQPGDAYIGRWYNELAHRAKNNPVLCTIGTVSPYPTGYHAYVTRYGADHGGLAGDKHQVELRGIVATGWQGGQKVIVARWMKILPGKKHGRKA